MSEVFTYSSDTGGWNRAFVGLTAADAAEFGLDDVAPSRGWMRRSNKGRLRDEVAANGHDAANVGQVLVLAPDAVAGTLVIANKRRAA